MSIQKMVLLFLGNTARASWVVTRLTGGEVHKIYHAAGKDHIHFAQIIESENTDDKALAAIKKELKFY